MTKMTNKVKLIRKALDTVIKSKIRIWRNEHGTYCDVEDVTKMMIKYHALKPGEFDVNHSADGRDIGKTTTTLCALRLVRLQGHSATAVTSLWPIAILAGKETYDFLAKATEGMRSTLERIQKDGIYVNFGDEPRDGDDQPEPNCGITLWLSADLKFINITTGLVPNNQPECCVYCYAGLDTMSSAVPEGFCCQGTRHDPLQW